MLDQIDDYAKKIKKYLASLQDTSKLLLTLFLVVIILVTWSGVKAVGTNYHLQKQITALKQQNQLQQLSNQNLKLSNDYYKTNQYLELSARRNLGLGRPGETELLVPKDVALSFVKGAQPPKAKTASDAKPFYQRNFSAWTDFFLHRRQPQI